MKRKIILIICCFYCCNVYAETYYGEYMPYLSGVEEIIEETDTLKREEIKVYNNYLEFNVPTMITSDTKKCDNYYSDIYYDDMQQANNMLL